jgi:hypothetical protein
MATVWGEEDVIESPREKVSKGLQNYKFQRHEESIIGDLQIANK